MLKYLPLAITWGVALAMTLSLATPALVPYIAAGLAILF